MVRQSIEMKEDHRSSDLAVDCETSATHKRTMSTSVASGRIYAMNAPKILLETITARTALLVIALTYTIFIIGFAIDFLTIYKSFNSNTYLLDSYRCNSYTPNELTGLKAFGCSSGSNWNASVTDLSNVISVQLTVQQNNVTNLWSNTTMPSTMSFVYDINVYACYDSDGCANDYASSNDYTTDGSVWQHVVVLKNQQVVLNTHDSLGYSATLGNFISYELLANTFQNQESIPTNGLVKSYHFEVHYQSTTLGLFSAVNDNMQQYITYTVDIVTRPRQTVFDALTVILIFVTIILLGGYITVLRKQTYLLPEQKWLILYFVIVIFFQNPVYLGADWSPPSVGGAFTAFVFSYLGQAGLFMLWLLFADAVNRKNSTVWFFYVPKVFIVMVIFIVNMVILTFQFPGVVPGEHMRNAVEAVVNWSPALRNRFVGFTILYLILFLLWAVVWITRLILSGRALKRIPYMATRYIQLSYRFYFIQSTLVTFYYVFQYAAVIYFLSRGTTNAVYDTVTFTDNINTIVRQQTQLFGKTLFLTFYVAILAFLFLPANFWETSGNDGLQALAATYVISESELVAVTRIRRKALQKLKKNLINQVTRLDQLVHAKVDVFCVDIAIAMRSISFDAYYDPPKLKTVSGYEGGMHLEENGFELIDCYYDRSHEVFCFICKEIESGRLVVGFRGTASKRQMEDNLNYAKKTVDFNSLGIPTLDHIDGLNIKPIASEEDFELESVSDNEEDLLVDPDEEGLTYDEFGNGMVGRGTMGRIAKPSTEAENITMAERAGHVKDGIARALNDAVGATNQGINKVVGATTDLVVTAAAKTPVLKNIVTPQVHSGFWDAYMCVRGFIHAILRQELVKNPTTVFFTGHSLGGALATYAALDVSMHTIPRVNAYLKHQAKLKMVWERSTDINSPIQPANDVFSRSIFGLTHKSPSQNNAADGGFLRASSFFGGMNSNAPRNKISKDNKVFVNRIKVAMYNFGSPRVGNHFFAQLYNKLVPNTFRVVVDGDVVVGLPPNYTHIGTEILVDGIGSGSIIIDPSFVEKWLRTHIKSSVAAHSLLVYGRSMMGLKFAAEYMKELANSNPNLEYMDPLKAAMQICTGVAFDAIVKDRLSSRMSASLARGEHRASQTLTENPMLIEDSKSASQKAAESLAPTATISLTGKPDSDLEAGEPERAISSAADAVVKGAVTSSSNSTLLNKQFSLQSERMLDHITALESKHYEKDKEHMEEFMKQFKGNRGPNPVEWIKEHTVNKVLQSNKNTNGNNNSNGTNSQSVDAPTLSDERNHDLESALLK